MLFNSLEFLLFLPTVFIIYWFIVNKNLKVQNVFLLIVSYLFYGWWDWRFLSLIFISSSVDYIIGLKIYQEKSKSLRKRLLFCSLSVNLGFLAFFKYCNFFIDSFIDLLSFVGVAANLNSLNIILPVGISFYTFQTISYTIDIYNEKLKPEKEIVVFFAFVSFFPQLVAGPIERASNLLPQFQKTRLFKYDIAANGARQIMWGLFKKIVIADRCAKSVDYIFSNMDNLSGSVLIIGAVFFAFQIYCDFSGYSDIAIGVAALFGFKLMRNFKFPYFSRSIPEFWQRWHISLSTWFRDYLYIPLGGSRYGRYRQVRNILVTFAVSGLWHGANWSFILWGVINGILYIPSIFLHKKQKAVPSAALPIAPDSHLLPSIQEFFQMVTTFFLIVAGWIVFRASSAQSALHYFANTFSNILLRPFLLRSDQVPMLLIIILVVIEWVQRQKQHPLQVENLSFPVRWTVYWTVLITIFCFIKTQRTFIYFQF